MQGKKAKNGQLTVGVGHGDDFGKTRSLFVVIGNGILSPSSKGKIVASGEAAGLQIQLGPPAVPGRFDSCDLPPKNVRMIPNQSFNFLKIIKLECLFVRASPMSSP